MTELIVNTNHLRNQKRIGHGVKRNPHARGRLNKRCPELDLECHENIEDIETSSEEIDQDEEIIIDEPVPIPVSNSDITTIMSELSVVDLKEIPYPTHYSQPPIISCPPPFARTSFPWANIIHDNRAPVFMPPKFEIYDDYF